MFSLFSFTLLHGRLTADRAALFLLYPVLSLVHFFTLHTWTLFLAFCLLLLFFQSPVLPFSSSISPLPLHHLSLTPSFSPLPLPAYLLSVCPCSVSPLAHLSLSPRAYCHHAQSTHTSHTSLLSLFVSYLCPSFSLHISITTLCILPPYSCLISFYYAVAYTLKWCLISGLKWIAF